MAQYKVAELFTSINGEGPRAGQLAVFVRFTGCNLACSYCDTSWANEPGAEYRLMNEAEIVGEIRQTNVRNVTLTGGEPLGQPGIDVLLHTLEKESALCVEIETNGSMPLAPYRPMDNRPHMTMDYKLPGSGMEQAMCLDNFKHLESEDTIKFVCAGRADLVRAAQVIEKYALNGRCHIYLSPVFGRLDPAEMVEFMKEKQLNGVNLQLQLHKFIWDPQKRGV